MDADPLWARRRTAAWPTCRSSASNRCSPLHLPRAGRLLATTASDVMFSLKMARPAPEGPGVSRTVRGQDPKRIPFSMTTLSIRIRLIPFWRELPMTAGGSARIGSTGLRPDVRRGARDRQFRRAPAPAGTAPVRRPSSSRGSRRNSARNCSSARRGRCRRPRSARHIASASSRCWKTSRRSTPRCEAPRARRPGG